jgi:hypothetical protein
MGGIIDLLSKLVMPLFYAGSSIFSVLFRIAVA